MQHLNDSEKDKLTEIINIGAGNASIALSQMIKHEVKIKVPSFFVCQVEEAYKFIGRPEVVMTAVVVKILGDMSGVMLLVFTPEGALDLAGALTRERKKDIKILDEIDRSALREAGNILSGSCLTALSRFLDINILQSVPNAATDMLGALMNSILAEFSKITEKVLIFKVDFKVEKTNIVGSLFFLFDPQSTKKIIEITKKMTKTRIS